MSVLSKCFYRVLSTVNCHEIVHPHTSSCLHSALTSFWKPVPTTAKFFLPFFLISLATKHDNIDALACRDLAVTFLYAISAAFLTGTIGRWFMCILHNLLNRFTYYSIVCIPALLGSSVIFATPNKVAVMFAHSVFVMIVQVMIMKSEFSFFRRVSRSKWFRTITFMSLSALLLDSLNYVKPDISWFLQPLKTRKRSTENGTNGYSNGMNGTTDGCELGLLGYEKVCSHRKDCQEFNKKELKLYSKVAIAIELVRNTIQHFGYLKSNPFRGISKIVLSTNLKFVSFAVGYPSAYRLLTCLFNSYSGCETRIGNTLSAFLSAIFFYAYPNTPIFAHALACTIEILWQRYHQTDEVPKFKLLQQIHEQPLAKIFYVLGCGYLFHVRTFYPWQTPSILMKVMCLVTHDHTDEMIMNLSSALMPR